VAGHQSVAQIDEARSGDDGEGHMKRVLLATTVLILAGCSDDDPETQLAACKMEAMRLWPNEDASTGFRESHSHIDEYVVNCMRTHGYHLNGASADCTAVPRYPMQSACYETSTQSWFREQWNWVKKLGDRT
jgi:hypothetical protein